MQDDPSMLGSVETLVRKELGGLGGLREGLGHTELLKTEFTNILHAAKVFISNTINCTN